MSLVSHQNNFTAGEISPRLHGRGDLDAFKNGVARLSNMIVWRHGGVTRRMGSVYLRDAVGDAGRLALYRDADGASIVMEIVDSAIRFLDRDGTLIDQLAAPWTGAAIPRLRMAQSGVDLWLVETGTAPRRLRRLGNGSFSLTAPSLVSNPFIAGDWPRAVGFYEQRLVFASTSAGPQSLWFSRLAAPTDFTQGPLADDAIAFTIAADDGGTIRWLAPQRKLFVGATNGVWVVDAFDPSLGLAPDNISARRHTRTGAADSPPRAVADGVLFLQRGGTKLRALSYRAESGGFGARELSLMGEHLLRVGLDAMDHQEEPDEILWSRSAEGGLLGFTFDSDQGVSAWHDHAPGGGAIVESLCCPDGAALDDALWMIVRREVGGVTRRWIEALAPQYRPAHPRDYNGMIYLDAAHLWAGEAHGGWAAGAPMAAGATLTRRDGGRPLTGGDVGAVWRLSADGVEGFAEAEITAVPDADTAEILWLTDDPAPFLAADRLTAVEARASLDGLGRFEGAQVAVLADSATHPDRVVVGGAITLQGRATHALVGFSYDSVIETLDVAARQAPAARTRVKRVHRVDLDLVDSLGGRIGPPGAPGDLAPLRAVEDAMDAAPGLFSGVQTLAISAPHDRIGRLRIAQSLPLPLTLRGLTARMEMTD